MATSKKIFSIDMNSLDFIKLIIIYYGRFFIPLCFIIISLYIIYYKKDAINQKINKYIQLFFQFYILLLIIEVILFINPIFSHQPDRMTNLNFIIFAQIPLFALALYTIFSRIKNMNKKIIYISILACIWGINLFGTFDSPYICRTNVALTYNEVTGMEWYYEYRYNDNVIAPIRQIERFHDLFDDGEEDNRIYIDDHFGYNSNQDNFVENSIRNIDQCYIILMTIDELLYQNVPGYINIGRYTNFDYIKFRNDNSLDGKIFDNTNIEIYIYEK